MGDLRARAPQALEAQLGALRAGAAAAAARRAHVAAVLAAGVPEPVEALADAEAALAAAHQLQVGSHSGFALLPVEALADAEAALAAANQQQVRYISGSGVPSGVQARDKQFALGRGYLVLHASAAAIFMWRTRVPANPDMGHVNSSRCSCVASGQACYCARPLRPPVRLSRTCSRPPRPCLRSIET